MKNMKRLVWSVLILIISGSILYVQSNATPQKTGYIEIAGARLRLGMTKGEVSNKIAGVSILKVEEDYWGIGNGQPPNEMIQFTNGKLNYAQRYWKSKDNDIFESLYGVAKSLNQEGYSNCRLQTYEKRAPEMSAQSVWVECGEKSVSLVRET